MRLSARAGWLAAALAVNASWIARTMLPALDPGVIQDDARQHVFWMQRLADPALFQGDLFADYFASQAPIGYVGIYRALMLVVDPIVASKLLPPILGLVAAAFTYLLVAKIQPSPHAAFLAAILDGWYVWQYDDLPTGSPRALLLPLTVVLLWSLASGHRWLPVAIVGLAATIYPSAAALGVALIGGRLLRLDGWLPRLDLDRRVWQTCGLAAGLALVLLAPAVLGGSAYGPAVDGRMARELAEFGPGGRNAFFNPDPYVYWIASYRSGLDLRVRDPVLGGVPLLYELAALALTFPLAAMLGDACARAKLAPAAGVLVQILMASFGLFFAAHLLLFRLYLPARFVAWTVPLVLAIAAGIGLALALDWLARRLAPAHWAAVATALTLLPAVALVTYPAAYDGNFVRDRVPAITEYLRTLPPDAVVAGVPAEADSVPALAGRPVVTNREYALAYHQGYYNDVRQRTLDSIDAYYAESPGRVAEFAARYHVQVFLVNRLAFEPETAVDAWAGEFEPYTSTVLGSLRRSGRYALLDAARRCGVLTEGGVTVVPASCFTPAGGSRR